MCLEHFVKARFFEYLIHIFLLTANTFFIHNLSRKFILKFQSSKFVKKKLFCLYFDAHRKKTYFSLDGTN